MIAKLSADSPLSILFSEILESLTIGCGFSIDVILLLIDSSFKVLFFSLLSFVLEQGYAFKV